MPWRMKQMKEEKPMICTCERCNYTFQYDSLPLTCPDCGATVVREATLEEKDWYYDLQAEKLYNPLLLDRIYFEEEKMHA